MEDFRGEIGWFEKELRAFEEDETDTIYFPRTETEWRREGPPISERRFHEYGGSVMAESSVEYAATQVVGESFVSEAVPRREAILRIWQEIPKGFESATIDRSAHLSRPVGPLALAELFNLKELNKVKGNCTARLIDYFIWRQDGNDPVKGGYKLYLLEEKLFGYDLLDFDLLPTAQRRDVRNAFSRCFRLFTAHGFQYLSPHRSNVVWDHQQGRCYFIHLENAMYVGDNHAAEPDFAQWELKRENKKLDIVDSIDPTRLFLDYFGSV